MTPQDHALSEAKREIAEGPMPADAPVTSLDRARKIAGPLIREVPMPIERALLLVCDIEQAIDEAIAEERKPKSIEQLNEQQGTKPWTGESLGGLSDKETDELLAAIHEGSEEARIQRAVDEALERAAVMCDGNHGSFGRAFARDIRKMKSQPLPPTVKHGEDCPKASHEFGATHAYDDNGPYWIDRKPYCGRCHQAL